MILQILTLQIAYLESHVTHLNAVNQKQMSHIGTAPPDRLDTRPGNIGISLYTQLSQMGKIFRYVVECLVSEGGSVAEVECSEVRTVPGDGKQIQQRSSVMTTEMEDWRWIY